MPQRWVLVPLSCLKSAPAFFWLAPSYWLTAKLYIVRLLRNGIRLREHPSGIKRADAINFFYKRKCVWHIWPKSTGKSWAQLFFSLILTRRGVGSSSVPRCCVNVGLDFVAGFMLAQLHSMLRCQASTVMVKPKSPGRDGNIIFRQSSISSRNSLIIIMMILVLNVINSRSLETIKTQNADCLFQQSQQRFFSPLPLDKKTFLGQTVWCFRGGTGFSGAAEEEWNNRICCVM